VAFEWDCVVGWVWICASQYTLDKSISNAISQHSVGFIGWSEKVCGEIFDRCEVSERSGWNGIPVEMLFQVVGENAA
jgi:hypothetical protein